MYCCPTQHVNDKFTIVLSKTLNVDGSEDTDEYVQSDRASQAGEISRFIVRVQHSF